MCNTLPNGVCTLNHIPIVFCVGFLSITICGFCVRVGFTLRFGSSDDRFCLVRLFHGYNSIDSAGNWQIAAVFCFICSESTQPSHTRFFPERFFVLYIAIMTLSIVQGFSKSLAMTVLSEIGDKTFFAAAILAMRHPRRYVLAGCLTALIVMTILSAAVGMAAPNLISRTLSKHITTVLFFGFGLWSLWDAYKDGDSEELAEVEAELDANVKPNSGTSNKGDDD